MDDDLRDLLAAWRGDDDPGEERRAALLARLRDDPAFRRAFLNEVHLLGMLKVVQSAEPRWLRLEDELGWSGRERSAVPALEDRVMDAVRARARPRYTVRLAWVAGLAAAVLVGLLAWPRFFEKPVPAAPEVELGTVVRLDGVRWHGDAGPAEGGTVTSGRLRLLGGRASLAFYNGVSLAIEGPADVDLLAVDRVFCRQGKLRTRVPPGAEGFTVLLPGAEVVDLGAELGLNQGPDGPARLMVFGGQAAASVLGKDGQTQRGALLEHRRSVALEAQAGVI
jgi:hypothetical protein